MVDKAALTKGQFDEITKGVTEFTPLRINGQDVVGAGVARNGAGAMEILLMTQGVPDAPAAEPAAQEAAQEAAPVPEPGTEATDQLDQQTANAGSGEANTPGAEQSAEPVDESRGEPLL